MACYAIVQGDSKYNMVKIGYVHNVKKADARRSSLQTGNPNHLFLLAATEFRTEEHLHKKFNICRIRGEWFRINDKILKELWSWERIHEFFLLATTIINERDPRGFTDELSIESMKMIKQLYENGFVPDST